MKHRTKLNKRFLFSYTKGVWIRCIYSGPEKFSLREDERQFFINRGMTGWIRVKQSFYGGYNAFFRPDGQNATDPRTGNVRMVTYGVSLDYIFIAIKPTGKNISVN